MTSEYRSCEKYGTFGFLNPEQFPQIPLLLLDFGIERRKNEAYLFENNHRDYDGYLFQYTLSGYGCFEKGGALYYMTPGTAFFSHIPEESIYYLPCPPNREEQADPDNCWEFLYVHFIGPAACPFFDRIQETCGSILSLPQDSDPILLWRSLHAELTRGNSPKRYETGELVYRFLSSLLRTLEAPARPAMSGPVRDSMDYMNAHYADHFSMEELAECRGLSAAYFTRLFTGETGIPPIQYLQNVRLTQALYLLLNTGLTVEDIAAACGFSCGNYFSKVFRKASGCSPMEYRKRNGR